MNNQSRANDLEERSIPVIDLAGVRGGVDGAADTAAEEIRAALTDIGFFSIVGHGVAWDRVEEIYGQAARFHALEHDTKAALTMSADLMGYNPLGASQKGNRLPSLNAAFFFARPGSRRNQLPPEEALPGFNQTVSDYYRTMEEVGQLLLTLYGPAAGMPADHFGQFFQPSLATLRLTHYPAMAAKPDQWGIDPHSDAGFMTMLPSNPVAGLQLKPAGAPWFAVRQEPESFVVNAGDMLRRWSNDRFRSTVHRAKNDTDTDRYAIPFFFDPRPDTVIDVLPTMIDSDHPKLHEPLVYRDYLTAFMANDYAPVRGERV